MRGSWEAINNLARRVYSTRPERGERGGHGLGSESGASGRNPRLCD